MNKERVVEGLSVVFWVRPHLTQPLTMQETQALEPFYNLLSTGFFCCSVVPRDPSLHGSFKETHRLGAGGEASALRIPELN